MNTLLGFGVLILVIINFAIYHKFVIKFYTGFEGCATEIFWIVIFTAIEIAIIRGIILKILGALGALLGFVVKLVLIVAVISIVIYAVWKIVQIVRSKTDINGEVEKSVNPAQSNQNMSAKNVSNEEVIICAKCGKAIKKESKFCQFCGSRMEDNT